MTRDETIEAMALAIYDILEGPVADQDYGRQMRQWYLAKSLAEAAYKIARNEVLEDAAKAWDKYGHAVKSHIALAAEQIATDVRAMKEK